MSTTTLTARCHCRSVHFTLTVPTTSLPLKAHLCHCTLCRTTHGTPASFHTPLPEGVNPIFIAPSSWDNLTSYLPKNSKEPLYFCSTCGCHVGVLNPSGIWGTSISIFEGGNQCADGKIWAIDEHIYTEKGSTGDGGIAELVPSIGGEELSVWNPDEEGTEFNPGDTGDNSSSKEAKVDDTLLAQCNCGGVSFTISRPHEDYINSPRSKGWIHPSDRKKWLALFDVCDDCRLLTGAHLTTWLFVPMDHITPSLPENLLLPGSTLKRYESTPGKVTRTFCGTCGATVFCYYGKRNGIVDVGTGILRAREGVMLRDWAVWRTAKLGFPDDGVAYDQEFTEGLDEGVKEWARRVHGGVVDFGGAGPEAD
ncbi:Mss4-like protein [Aspergillus pseudoustus]|uniref:Mss4-like protein n=1 Tax=Aspergillus pseudoustus TaxID=1810923 RepID=A0ABR4I8X2_9EURO